MGVFAVDHSNASPVTSVEEMAGKFYGELIGQIPRWRERLRRSPDQLEHVEHEVRDAFGRGADLVVVGLLAVIMGNPEFERESEKLAANCRHPLRKGRARKIQLRMLSGLVVWVTSLYCAPDRRQAGGQKLSGLYAELARFGFGKGITPALETKVARQTALCPSHELARDELERQGLTMDIKTVRRISIQCGEGFLRLRKDWLSQWREGTLASGMELSGKRVSVQIDGGRTKIRGELRLKREIEEPMGVDGLPVPDAPGRSKPTPQRTYDAEWREPKVVTIFTHDEHGRMEKDSIATIEGTFEGPDAIAELVAMHLHRLGASRAISITFVSDGAPWIWDRIKMILELAQLQDVTIHEVLDNCHASHHVSLALAALGLGEAERKPLYQEHRSLLRNGQWRRVVDELTELSREKSAKQQRVVTVEIAYLTKHGKAGRLSYPHFRGLGIPLGSGAIESTIRRVINQRLKGNSISWRQPHAEAMMQLRAQVISKRWDENIESLRHLRRISGDSDWTWQPRPMREEFLEANSLIDD
jgi:hypothetical protein